MATDPKFFTAITLEEEAKIRFWFLRNIMVLESLVTNGLGHLH